MPTCPQCPVGPSFSGQASSLERRTGDTDEPTSELMLVANSSPLGDVLDWLGKSDVRDHATFAALPIDEPPNEAEDANELVDHKVPSEINATTRMPLATSDVAISNFSSSTSTLPRLQPHSLHKALAFTDPSADGVLPQAAGNSRGSPYNPTYGPIIAPAASSWDARGPGPGKRVEPVKEVGGLGAACPAGANCPGSSLEQQPNPQWTLEQEEDDEWAQRQKRTGTVGRLVQYTEGEKPTEDLLLRGGNGSHVVVAAVRDGGPASKVGIKAGDRLVSVDGNKDILYLPADTIRERLESPTVLVFIGFVGKLQAEVRLSCADRICGLSGQQSALAPAAAPTGNDSRFVICEERVFNARSASLFLTTEVGSKRPANFANDIVASGMQAASHVASSDASAVVEDNVSCCSALSSSSVFELQRNEAHTLVRRAMAATSRSRGERSPPPMGSSGDMAGASGTGQVPGNRTDASHVVMDGGSSYKGPLRTEHRQPQQSNSEDCAEDNLIVGDEDEVCSQLTTSRSTAQASPPTSEWEAHKHQEPVSAAVSRVAKEAAQPVSPPKAPSGGYSSGTGTSAVKTAPPALDLTHDDMPDESVNAGRGGASPKSAGSLATNGTAQPSLVSSKTSKSSVSARRKIFPSFFTASTPQTPDGNLDQEAKEAPPLYNACPAADAAAQQAAADVAYADPYLRKAMLAQTMPLPSEYLKPMSQHRLPELNPDASQSLVHPVPAGSPKVRDDSLDRFYDPCVT